MATAARLNAILGDADERSHRSIVTPEGVALPEGDRVRLARHGIDDVEILLAANPGATPRSVAALAVPAVCR